jgi:anti-anti-sigma factor
MVCDSAIKIEPSDPAGDAPCPNCGHLLWFTWDNGDEIVIKPTCSTLRAEDLDTLADRVSEHTGVQLVLDLGEVQHLEGATLGKLVSLKKRVAAARGRLRLENLHPNLVEVFHVTRLDQVFDVGR